ncbi:unnamed protein product [Penicillium roqueforti FM164]|uniref:Genomic scaffold, ProqFM164S03 n=1 Tax=Penicillium roqueforti (strain FM164) TaxID=1365484 RepID=W6QIB9_PENRF|nr:unnamed protein product [Penicillium roqueforti FM164]
MNRRLGSCKIQNPLGSDVIPNEEKGGEIPTKAIKVDCERIELMELMGSMESMGTDMGTLVFLPVLAPF